MPLPTVKIRVTEHVRKPYDKYVGWEFDAIYDGKTYEVIMPSPFKGAGNQRSKILYLVEKEVEIVSTDKKAGTE